MASSASASVAALSIPAERQHGINHGMWGMYIFVMSEVLFFSGLFTSYFFFKSTMSPWPPASTPANQLLLPTINTVVLVSSGFVMHWASGRIRKGDRRGLIIGTIITIVMGLIFLGGQAVEYHILYADGLTLTSNQFGQTFFILTGFHGMHVLGGLLILTAVLVRSLLGQFDANHHVVVEAGTFYWHFVDVVWVLLYIILYLIR